MKNISIIGYFALCLTPFFVAPQPASAMTLEEFIRAVGILDRTLQDIDRTFPHNTTPESFPTEEPTSAPEPSTEEEIQPF